MSITDIASAVQTFLQIQPWEQVEMDAALVFALQREKNRKSYAVLMKKAAGCSLVLCEDEQALSVYASLVSARNHKADEMESVSLSLEQNSLEFWLGPTEDAEINRWLARFDVKTPEYSQGNMALIRREPARIPRKPCAEEEERLAVAIHAAIDYVSNNQKKTAIQSVDQLRDRLYIPCARLIDKKSFLWSGIEIGKDMAMEFPSPCLKDELAIRRLKKTASSGHDFICALRTLPLLLDENNGQVPCVMLMIDSEIGMIDALVVQNVETDASALAGEFLRYVEEFGKPERIQTSDPRSYCLLHGLARQLDIRLEQGAQTRQVNEAMRQFLSYMLESVERQDGKKNEAKKEEKKNQGICVLCGREFPGEKMKEHLAECRQASKELGDMPYFLLKIICPEEKNYWMYLEAKKDTSLKQLDRFLRDRWLECCGHTSVFFINDIEYYSFCDEPGMKGMNVRLEQLVKNGDRFSYQYDFGTPTNLEIEIIDEYTAKNRHKKIILAAQNVMPKLTCIRCGEQASRVFRPGGEQIQGSVFCEKCAEKERNRILPLLNSPRTGVCGYGLWMEDEE